MKGLDFKSLLIGILSTALVAVVMGAGQQSTPAMPRYQIAGVGGDLFVLNNTNNSISVLTLQDTPNKMPSERNWIVYRSFSLDDAVTKPEGAAVKPGPGRSH